ncbi:MAG: hypothetical protein NKF70_12085 [Methanobacterium sp. ERen5]|nr:MAG: hypothetical protein NKF70_12085 [Methanobacterium sp. ERen5]
MSNFKNLKKVIETNVESVHKDFKLQPSEIGKTSPKTDLNPVDVSKVPKEQRDKLDSYIKQWENPSKWYECRIQGLEWFISVAQKNNVSPEHVEFVIEKTSKKQPILKPMVKSKEAPTETKLQMEDMDKLRKFLKLYPQYKIRVENGENIADIAISIIKNHIENEERRKLGLDN